MGATASLASTYGAAKGAGEAVQKALTPQIPTPQVPAAPPLPSSADTGAAMSQAQQAQRKRALASFGRSDTILTGPLGLQDAAIGARKTLLGS